jgi:hypothetical protein
MATVQMRKGDLFADIFDSPETIAQARRDGYSLVDPEEIKKHSGDLEELSKPELLELARQKGVFEKSLASKKKGEIIEWIKVAKSEEESAKAVRAKLIQAAIAKGFEETYLDGLSDDELAALPEKPESIGD